MCLYEEALPLLKEYHNYYKSKNELSREYFRSVAMLSNVYNKVKMPDYSLLISNECFDKVKSNKVYPSKQGVSMLMKFLKSQIL